MSLAKRLTKLSLEELRTLNHQCINEINLRLREEGEEAARKLDIGDRVYFENKGERVEGKLRKIGVKNAKVEIEAERIDGKVEVRTWSVPTALLHPIKGHRKKAHRKLHHKKIPTKRNKFVPDMGEL